jgi:hypothetical protein
MAPSGSSVLSRKEVAQMDRKRQRKLERKRARQKKRKARELARTTTDPTAYHGKKFRTAELVEFHCEAEKAILEAFVVTDRQLTDHVAADAVKRLIDAIRCNALPTDEEADSGETDIEDFIVWRIRQNWEELFETRFHPGRDKLVGVLRSILASVEIWGSPNPNSRGYLEYVEDFLGNLGISVEQVDPETREIESPEEYAINALSPYRLYRAP